MNNLADAITRALEKTKTDTAKANETKTPEQIASEKKDYTTKVKNVLGYGG